MYLGFAVVVFPHTTLANTQNSKHNESLLQRQMMKVLARPTNYAEQFRGQRKRGKLKWPHLTKFCAGLHEKLNDLSINEQRYVSRTAIRVMRQTLVSTCSL